MLSQNFIHLFWDGDIDACTEYLADDTVMLDANTQQRHVGKNAVSSYLMSRRTRYSSNYAGYNEAYDVDSLGDGVCNVTARYAVSNPDKSATTNVMCSFVWSLDADGKPSMRMCGRTVNSQSSKNETDQLEANKPRASQSSEEKRIALQAHDTAGTTHWVLPEHVIYVAAAHQYTNVYCRDRLIHLRASFTQVLDQLDDVVVRIHRSYAVNPAYISYMDNEELHLTNGAKIPVPVKRVRKVRQMLAEYTDRLGKRE